MWNQRNMVGKTWCVLFLLASPAAMKAWTLSGEERREGREMRRGLHYHSKRHMLTNDNETKKGMTSKIPREARKKPSGHLTPLEEDDIENDEVVSVAIGPPPIRPKYNNRNRLQKTNRQKNNETAFVTDLARNVLTQLGMYNETTTNIATELVRNVLTQLGREMLTRQVNENFVFGQYLGNAMRNLTSDLRLKMQHEVLDLIVKYQKINKGEVMKTDDKSTYKDVKGDKRLSANDTEESWPDFTNLAGIVG